MEQVGEEGKGREARGNGMVGRGGGNDRGKLISSEGKGD